MKAHLRKGFTLIELMVVITIIGILASIVFANLATAAKRGRDAERQADIRNLQSAIEAYKHKNGVYPDGGCPDSNGWSNEKTCSVYIKNLAPAFIPTLPHDGARGNNEGYSYVVNNPDNTVYKVMAMNTVEADVIDYNHPFKSCDIRFGDSTQYSPALYNQVDLYGWCDVTGTQFSPVAASTNCIRKNDQNDNGDYGTGRFDHSYALWGGFAAGTGKGTNESVAPTAAIICK